MIKRILGGALAAISMFVSVTMLPVSAAKYELAAPSGYVSPFKDLQKDDWYYEFVSTLNSAGMIDGYGDGYFGANDPLTAGAALAGPDRRAGRRHTRAEARQRREVFHKGHGAHEERA